jgi:hypothetical protein
MKALFLALGKVAALLVMVMASLVGLVRALPYDRSEADELQAFLFPAGCRPPCVMGMTPDVTTWQEANVILDGYAARDWIRRDARDQSDDAGTGAIVWTWNKASFPFDYSTRARSGSSVTNIIMFDDDIINSINVSTSASYGDIRLMLGRPSTLILTDVPQLLSVRYSGLRADYNFDGLPCRRYPSPIFEMPTDLVFRAGADDSLTPPRPMRQHELMRWFRTMNRLRPMPCR